MGLTKKALLAFTIGAIGVFAEPALAADVGGSGYGLVPGPAFTWTGIYAGVNIGDGWEKHKTRISGVTTSSGVVNGVIGGGQVGANWQVGRVVWGIEADGQASGQSKSTITPFPAFNLTDAYSQPWFATFRGRVGWAFADRWLVYATAGGAWLDSKATFTASAGVLSLSSAFELSHIGWTAGAGLEGAITRNWSWKVEYLHLQTGRFSTNVNFFGAAVPWTARLGDNIARIGINYRL